MKYNVYLSGEIHTSWREEIIKGCEELGLNIEFTSAVTNHEASDAAGDCLLKQDENFNRDNQSAKVNAIRIKTLIQKSDERNPMQHSKAIPFAVSGSIPKGLSTIFFSCCVNMKWLTQGLLGPAPIIAPLISQGL